MPGKRTKRCLCTFARCQESVETGGHTLKQFKDHLDKLDAILNSLCPDRNDKTHRDAVKLPWPRISRHTESTLATLLMATRLRPQAAGSSSRRQPDLSPFHRFCATRPTLPTELLATSHMAPLSLKLLDLATSELEQHLLHALRRLQIRDAP